jgi:hypothetical protein
MDAGGRRSKIAIIELHAVDEEEKGNAVTAVKKI